MQARLAVQVNSEIGRTEYLLVGLVERADAVRQADTTLAAYPMGQGSGSVTTFSRADGFTTSAATRRSSRPGRWSTVQLLGRELQLADLVVIGSHCIGLDYLLGELQQARRAREVPGGRQPGRTRGGEARRVRHRRHSSPRSRQTGEYNRPFLTPALTLIPGYGRLQGIVFRRATHASRDATRTRPSLRRSPIRHA